MVGIFSRFSGYRRFHFSPEDKREFLIPKGDEVAEAGCKRGLVEFNFEFKPIEHPLEPTNEDHPVKCPMPNSSVLNDGDTRRERTIEILRKRAEFAVENEEGMVVAMHMPPADAVRKRHQTLTRNRSSPPLLRAPESDDILQMLGECNQFEPSMD